MTSTVKPMIFQTYNKNDTTSNVPNLNMNYKRILIAKFGCAASSILKFVTRLVCNVITGSLFVYFWSKARKFSGM